jgi:hypothetical protein
VLCGPRGTVDGPTMLRWNSGYRQDGDGNDGFNVESIILFTSRAISCHVCNLLSLDL